MTNWLYALAPYHDYGWFIALLAWAAAAVVWRRTLRGEPGWAWLPWAAWPGVASAIIELVSFAWPVRPLEGLPDHVPEDVMLGLAAAVVVGGWVWTLRVNLALRLVAAVGALVVAGLRVNWPGLGAVALAAVGTIAALAHALAPTTSRRQRIALAAAAIALWLSSAGPLASSGFQSRRWIELGEWSAIWSTVQAMAALIALMGVVAPRFAHSDSYREWRPLLLACALWLVLGLGLAATMSEWSRHNFEAQTVGRVRMAAALMEKTAFEKLLGEDFKLTEIAQTRRRSGAQKWRARVELLSTSLATKPRHELAEIEQADPDVLWAHGQTIRDGWLVIFYSDRYPPSPRDGRVDYVALGRPTAADKSDWDNQRGGFMPLVLDWAGGAGTGVHARAPLVSSNGAMLGWLVLEYPLSQWVAAQAQPRLQAYLIVALGFGLAALIAVQRVRTREREEARSAALAAAQADRLKTAFLAKVSHELRTPIQSVLGYGELLRCVVNHDPVGKRRLAALREHGELMLRLVNDLLDLSAIQAGAFRLVAKPTAMVDLAQQTVESLRPRAELKGLALSVTVAAEVPTWAGIDRERVRQVILNLVGNAIKFTDHGRVDVALEAGPRLNEVTLVVRDTGPGIPAESMGRLFHPFERLDGTAEKEGSGLGLALTAGICRSMGGDVAAESVVGAGATFRVWFQAPACVAPPNLAHSSGALPPLAGRRVLVADDNALVRALYVESLREAGAHCAAAEDGEQAFTAAEQESFDAVVLDLSMPRLDGMEVARRLRAAHRTVRIVGVSAHAGEREKEEALAAGMDAFLVKPVSLDALLSAIVAEPEEKRTPADNAAKLMERLREQFRGLAADEGAAVAAAIAQRDYIAVRVRAHHLLNSAAVIRDDRLFAACALIERAAETADDAALASAWQACASALEPWAGAHAVILSANRT